MTKNEAIQLCEKYKVDHTKYPHIVVTATGNIYTTGNVDPADKSEQIHLNGKSSEGEAPETTEEKPKKQGKK